MDEPVLGRGVGQTLVALLQTRECHEEITSLRADSPYITAATARIYSHRKCNRKSVYQLKDTRDFVLNLTRRITKN